MSEMALQLIRQAKAEGWKTLDLGNTGIVGEVPAEIWELTELEELILSDAWVDWWERKHQPRVRDSSYPSNRISSFPMQARKQISFEDHPLISKTTDHEYSSRRGLANLLRIVLSCTDVRDLTPLASLSRLQSVYLYGTLIQDTSVLKNFCQLKVLDLGKTSIKDCEPLTELSNLQRLRICNTDVSDIGFVARHQGLVELDLSSTRVTDIRPLASLSQLQILNLHNTKVQLSPEYIEKQGAQAIVQYLQQAQKEEEAKLNFINWQLKLVVVGNSQAGKTSLMQSWIKGELVSAEKSTLWLGYQPWQLGNVTLHMFDFGGQDYFHDAHHLFFSGNAAYLVLWDVRKDHIGWAEDVEGIMQLHYPLAYWLDAIRFHTGRPAKDKGTSAQRNGRLEGGEEEPFDKEDDQSDAEKEVLVGREADTIRALVVQTHTDETGIQHPDTRQLKADFPWIYDFEAISLDPKAPRRVQSLQDKLVEMLAELPSLGQKFLATYAWVRDALPAYAGASTCTKEAFRGWANKQVARGLEENKVSEGLRKGLLFRQENIDSLLRYLRDLGVVLYYPEVAVLRDTVFMRPEDIRKAALKVLKGLRKREGYFDEAYLSKCLGTEADIPQMLALMQQFKMAFRLPKSVAETKFRWVAPLYLPEAAPAGISLLLHVFERPVRRIVYPHFIHKSVILELFQTYVQDLYAADPAASQPDYLIWREGMVVQVKGSEELVLLRFFLGAAATEKDVEKAAQIDVFSFGEPDVKRRAADVLDTLARINKGWTTEEQVTVDGKVFVPLKALRDAAKAKQVVLVHAGQTIALEDYHDYVEYPFARVFVSYAEEDEEFARALEKFLQPLQRRDKLLVWTKRAITPGQHRDSLVRQELERADLVILLMSVDFFANKDIWQEEFKASLELQKKGQCDLFPVLVRQCDWQSTEVEGLALALPDPIKIPSNDDAWTELVHLIKEAIQRRKTRRGRI